MVLQTGLLKDLPMDFSNNVDIINAIARWSTGPQNYPVWDEVGWTETEWREWTSSGRRPQRLATHNPRVKLFEGEINIHLSATAKDEQEFSSYIQDIFTDILGDYGIVYTVASMNVREIEEGAI